MTLTAIAVGIGVALGFGLWCLASLAPRMSRPRLARRVAPYLLDVSAGAREAMAPAAPGPLPVVGMLFEPVVSAGRRALSTVLGGNEVIARRLRQAGSALSVEGFRSQQLLWALLGAVIGVVAAIGLARNVAAPVVAQIAVVIVFAVIGVAARDFALQQAASSRIARLTDELPVVLEFLTLSLSAGEGMLDAVRRISRTSTGELSAELGQVVGAVTTGLPFAESLQKLSRELELPAFTRCVDQVVGALERGTPLAEVLRAQAQDARDEAKRDLLELAGKKEVAMLLPLVFLILPITIAFAIFPGVVVLQVGF